MSHHPDDGGSMYLWNISQHSIRNMAVHPRIFWASYSLPWEHEISQGYFTSWLYCLCYQVSMKSFKEHEFLCMILTSRKFYVYMKSWLFNVHILMYVLIEICIWYWQWGVPYRCWCWTEAVFSEGWLIQSQAVLAFTNRQGNIISYFFMWCRIYVMLHKI
jgi:hypothetical protein